MRDWSVGGSVGWLVAMALFAQADATVWFEPKRNYAGAYYDEGFSNAALLQVRTTYHQRRHEHACGGT